MLQGSNIVFIFASLTKNFGNMERKIYQKLLEWKSRERRKPLIIRGARQTGKTWIMKEFGRREYENVIYVNFDLDKRLSGIFKDDYNIQRILLTLQAVTGIKPEPGKTLLILDEIQEVDRGLGALKYFCEDAPEYHVMVAGSLLGIALHQGTSFPVGKVDMLKIHPLDFEEFLWATGNKNLADLLASRNWDIVNTISNKYIQLLRLYYFVGGMPEAVESFVKHNDLSEVRNIQTDILAAYRNDVNKHAPAQEIPRISMVLDSLPSQLSRENKKFLFGAVRKGARAADFEIAIQWLIDCGIIHKVPRVREVGMPLKFYEDFNAFKIFLLDCGLLGALSEAPAQQMIVGDNIFKEFKGMFTEQFVLQQFMAQDSMFVYYHSQDKSDLELDFVVQHDADIFPVEVKAEGNVHAKSLHNFIDRHPNMKAIRLSMLDYIDQGWMTNYPLYAAGWMV